jgi:hypothetical protein
VIKSKLTDGSSRVECRPRKRTSAWLVFTAVLITVAASAKNKTTLPKLVVHAKYVLVTTYNGPDLTNPHVLPDDRQAAADVELAIRKWGNTSSLMELPNHQILFCSSGREGLPL